MISKRDIPRLYREYLPSVLLILLFLAAWEGGVRLFDVPRYILPTPSRIAYLIAVRQALLIHHTLVTLKEVAVGFTLALGAGVALALLIFHFSVLERALYPIIIASQTIPVFAIAPLLIVWFGYGIIPKVLMTALIVFFPIVVNTVDGLRSVDEDMVDLLRILRANRWTILLKARLPAALPFVFSGVKIGVAVSVIGAVIGEWVGSTEGLGYLMIHANAQLQIDVIFAAIIYLSIMAVGLFGLFALLERLALPWRRL
ncbi:MAG: ABC transporter permease [bacterium]